MLINEGAVKRYLPVDADLPALFFSLTIFTFNFVGDGLRDALDPKIQGIVVKLVARGL